MASKKDKNEMMDRRELIKRAQELVPLLREKAFETEQNRHLSDDIHQKFIDAGFYKIFQPKKFGGLEMDVGIIVDIAAELGRGCGSAAWIFTNVAVHGLINGMKDAKAQEELWGTNPDTIIVSAHPGKDAHVEVVDGGLQVDGIWNYSSGVDFADWVNLQIFLTPEDGPAEHRFSLVPVSEIEIIDDWYVSGLAGTCSRSISMNKVFIPRYRQISSLDMHGGPTPGSAINPGTLYKLPFWGIGAKLFSAPPLGMARGALELTEQDIENRISIFGAKLAEQPTVLAAISESAAEIEAAWAVLARDCRTAEDMTIRDEIPTLLQRTEWRRNNAYAVVLCLRATDRLHGLAGMRAMDPSSHIQRCWRDIHAAASQVAIAWDTQAINYGKARFGLPFSDPRA
ncbi:MAG: acyl-CoA dehydrogenase family protein [Rhodospirillales bacterium]|nr:acyl-CoA dehydrogenase family protein [Rhodospirillales bacterium]